MNLKMNETSRLFFITMSVLNTISQAHGSFTYVFTFTLASAVCLGLVFGFVWLPIVFFICLALGMLERRFINKRLTKAPGTAVVITGCSTGFGFRLATRLSQKGIYVFAGVRKEVDGTKLKKGTLQPENIHPLLLDVTNEEQVLAATVTVDEVLSNKGLSLLSLVNNAGYGDYGPIEAMSVKRVRNMFEVNVFGVITVTQAFLPLLRKYYTKKPLHSRIINISSGAGRIALPNAGQYCSSKYAMEALSDALRMELRPWNIGVIVVEPGRFHTDFQDKAYKEFVADGFSALDDVTTAHYTSLVNHENEKSALKKRPPAENCVQVIEDALFDTRPLARYLAGPDVQTGVPLLNFLNRQELITDSILGSSWKKLKR